jgi:2-desacetyl-2-hydroxyethyl bacteriochlorophyllide A dehydrogenase
MKALVFNFKKNKLIFKEVPLPNPKKGWALVKIGYSALCGTDLHVMNGVLSKKAYGKEIILGHAWSGNIAKSWDTKSRFKTGDAVLGGDYIPCLNCRQCRKNKHNLCDKREIPGIELAGTHAQYAILPENVLLKIHRRTSPIAACYAADVVAVAYHAITISNVKKEDRIAIYGMGPMGIIIGVLLKKIWKISNISIAEPSSYRKTLAGEIFNPKTIKPVHSKLFTNEFDLVFDASGSENALSDAFHRTARGGKIIIVGVHDRPYSLSTIKLVSREITLQGSFTYNKDELKKSISLLNKIPFEKLVTHIFPLEQGSKAYRLFSNKKTGAVVLKI